MFTGERGDPIRSGNRNLLTGWKDAVAAIGRPGLHLHDIWHTGNTFAALIYQHVSRQVDQTIADKLSALVEDVTGTNRAPNDRDDGDEDGPAGVLISAG